MCLYFGYLALKDRKTLQFAVLKLILYKHEQVYNVKKKTASQEPHYTPLVHVRVRHFEMWCVRPLLVLSPSRREDNKA